MRMNTSPVKRTLTLFFLAIIAVLTAAFAVFPAGRVAFAEELTVNVEKIELPADEPSTIIFYFDQTDFITAEFDENDNTAARYKWVNELAYEDRESYNVCNALLNKNLNEYNYGEYVTVDGVQLKNIGHELRANKFQRIEGLGLTLYGTVLQNATEIYIKGGCTLPTLARGYFGVSEPSAMVVAEDTIYRKREGQWVRAYPFDGYEEGVVYDASERFFYKRPEGSSFMGHTEAPTCEISTGYKPVGDNDCVLCTSINTLKGNLMVIDLVNPIDSKQFGTLTLRFYVHEPRTMVSYNANGVTADDLGEVVEMISTAKGWTNVPFMLPLYADEDGMVDRLVLQFTNDGDTVNAARNQVGIGEFTLSRDTVKTLLYDKSLIISETDEQYNLAFRFNKKGEFYSSAVDEDSFLINGESLAEINADGEYATAEWVSLQGIYQINVTLSKSYTGEGQIKNADIGYACNRISVVKGLEFPNGELLDRTYHYNLYRSFTDRLIFEDEVVIDYESSQTYAEVKPEHMSGEISLSANGNLHFTLLFDKKITNRMINHICEHEDWRESILGQNGLYNESFTDVFIAGGYKSSLMNGIVINGQSVGEFHARNNHQTCIIVHYGQRGFNSMDISIDANAPAYAELKQLFESGSGITVEIKEGLKFATGVMTMRDYVFNMKDGAFVLEREKPEYAVYFDGKKVTDGQALKVDYPPISSSIYVYGTDFEVEESRSGNTVTFTVKYDGEQTVFSVEQTVVEQPDTSAGQKKGCGASAAGGVCGALIAAAVLLRRRNRYE